MWGSSVPCEDPQSHVRTLSPTWGPSVPREDPQSHVRTLSPTWGPSVPREDPQSHVRTLSPTWVLSLTTWEEPVCNFMFKVFLHKVWWRWRSRGAEDFLSVMVEDVRRHVVIMDHRSWSLTMIHGPWSQSVIHIRIHDVAAALILDPRAMKQQDSGEEVTSVTCRWDINVMKREKRKEKLHVSRDPDILDLQQQN